MKLSTKIFCGIVGSIIGLMAILTVVIVVQGNNKIKKNYPAEFIPLRKCKVIEIGNNWDISIQDSMYVPVYSTITNGDTISSGKQFGIHIRHFDPQFMLDVKNHIELKNDTLRFKDLDNKQLNYCYLYIEPSFEIVDIGGNSKIDFMGSTQHKLNFAQLNINASERSGVYINNTNIHTLRIYGRDQSTIKFYYQDTVSSIKKIELRDYSVAEIHNLYMLSKYHVADHASLIFHDMMAISKNKIVNLKRNR